MPLDGMPHDERRLLESHGWQLTNAHAFTTDPWTYRSYVCASRGEFTVAKDQNVRLRSGWFSERSACYLAAGRPVVTEDTGFGAVLPTGEGLFAFNTMEDIVAAIEAIRADYNRHSRAARRIAEEHFKAETVLAKVIEDLGL
jgi:glycosyltransferase involved in cell wall biosynthesis